MSQALQQYIAAAYPTLDAAQQALGKSLVAFEIFFLAIWGRGSLDFNLVEIGRNVPNWTRKPITCRKAVIAKCLPEAQPLTFELQGVEATKLPEGHRVTFGRSTEHGGEPCGWLDALD